MIHVGALPGTPSFGGSMTQIIERAVAEAEVYRAAGVDALAIENMHDTPYLRGAVGPEIPAALTAVGQAVKQAVPLPCGVQVLAGANEAALAVAVGAGLDFIRAEGFVFAHVGDEGLHQSCAGHLLRYRRALGAQDVLVFADIKKKHSSHALTADVDVAETARAAAFFRADGLVVTGKATGRPTKADDLRQVRGVTDLPVLVGSGVTEANLEQYTDADGLLVGSHFKQDGHWENPVDKDRVVRFMDKKGSAQ
jgi:membrane complex biogenesis BtpA family protein